MPDRTEDEKKYVKQCYCNKNGCMETYVSGPGFASCFNLKHNTNYDSHEILEEFNNNKERAIEALKNYVDPRSYVKNQKSEDIIEELKNKNILGTLYQGGE